MRDIETKIARVTVFRDGARVTRIGKTEIPKGEQKLRVTGITEYAHQDSFRVKGHGKAILRSIDVKRTTMTYEPKGDAKDLLEKIKTLEKERRGIQDQINSEQNRITHLNAIGTQFSTEFGKWYSAGESSMDNLTKMDKASQDLLKNAKKNLRTLSRELERIDAEISTLRENIQRILGERRTETLTEVYIDLEANESTTLELEVTYQLSLASWYPTYDVDIGEGKTTLKRIASVYNNSREHWEDVNLVVSTASARPVEAVKPQPFYLDIYHPQPMTGYGMPSGPPGGTSFDKIEVRAIRDEVSIEEDMLMEPKAKPMVEEYAEASEGFGGITAYNVPGNVTIESSSDPHPITLVLDEFESKRLHYWNAYAMPEVVAQDEITNGDLVIPPGGVKVYASGDFIGETSVESIAPREKFRLGTRASYDVKAEKKLIEKDTEKAGLTRGKQKRGYKYALELKNFSKKEIEIRIVDRIPYSSSEKITVEMGQPSLPYKKMELGVITWETKLEANQELTIEYGFDVEWEKDLIVRPPLP
ncbi:MAG: mucoidy inhibitor MuiA family protein [Candidatus Thorarchaeota archaeon]|nr:mucoidy inhibitor MuiA family protein [Candidatus Thorarchaeota archaeon]